MNGMQMFIGMCGNGGGSVTPPGQYDYDLFISAGQSNIDSRVPFIERPSFILPNADIPGCKMWNVSGQFDDWNLETNSGASPSAYLYKLWSFDAVFYNNITKTLGVTPLIIKRSEGGTAIEIGITNKGCWNVDFNSIPEGEPKLLQELGLRINEAINYLTTYGKTYKFRGIIWHQGEADQLTTAAQDNYYQNFKDVIAYLRTLVNEPNLPVIYGMIPDVSASYNLTIRNAQIQIANEDSNAYLVDLSDLTLLDAYHFDAASSIIAGNRYSEIFINNNL